MRQEAEFRGHVCILRCRPFKGASSEKSAFLFEVTLPIEEKTQTKWMLSRNGRSLTCGKQDLDPAWRGGSWEDEDAPRPELLCLVWDLGQTQTDLLQRRFQLLSP